MSYTISTITSPPPESERELRTRVPSQQSASPENKSPVGTGHQQMNPLCSNIASTKDSASKLPTAGHHRFVLTDHIAFRYLEEDPSTTVLARRQTLQGYEVYLVEQWACSREHPTFIITTYTGDSNDSVIVSVLSVPADESAWSPRLRIYFEALNKYHARRRDTELGTLMITNLSGFPSSLTVIPVPEGDVKKYRELFLVNENLKRLGCSGRLGIKLAPPSSATQAKFHQLYRTSDKIPLNSAVIELVKLCQVALVLFGNLEPEYADGLLCDVTEKAINDWWVEFGAEYYTIEPHDGILGPTTVAALLGMFMGARNRLSAYNAPVAKDVFDIESTKRGIAYFQKTQRIQKTRRLDRHTLERLRRATAKAASGEGWAMPRALKSTVAELGGKGGEMVMGMVGARDKAGIADVETVDIDRFVEVVQGERAKWLWYGKPRKTTSGDMFSRLPGEEGLTSPTEQHANASRLLKRESTLEGQGLAKRETTTDEGKKASDVFGIVEGLEKDSYSKRAVLKKATGKIESGSGFGRIKDVVGRRSHQPKLSRDGNGRIPLHHAKSDKVSAKHDVTDRSPALHRPTLEQDHVSDATYPTSPRRSTGNWDGSYEASFTKTLTQIPRDSASALAVENTIQPHLDKKVELGSTIRKPAEPEDYDSSKPPTVENSIAGSIYRGIDLANILRSDEAQDASILLKRTQSSDQLSTYHTACRNDNWWPRRLSFSIAEESILTWSSLVTNPEEQTDLVASPQAELTKQGLLADDAKRLQEYLGLLNSIDSVWVEERITNVQELDQQADQDIQELEDMYYTRFDEYQALREDTHEILSRERLQLQEAVRDIETLGAKLEYEINTLRSKVDDVEDGVTEFERQVEYVEERVRELEEVATEREGWMHWVIRITTGIGRPPAPIE